MVLDMAGELFLRSNEWRDLEVFGARLFGILDAVIEQVRDSDNVAGGRYSVGKACGLRPGLRYWMTKFQLACEFPIELLNLIRERGSSSVQLDAFADIVANTSHEKESPLPSPLEALERSIEHRLNMSPSVEATNGLLPVLDRFEI